MSAAERQALGRHVGELRHRLGHRTLPDWEKAVGISAKTLGKLERGEAVSGNTLIAVAREVGVTVSDLLASSGNEIVVGSREPTYVTDPGQKTDDDEPEDRVLAAIQQMRTDQHAMERRLSQRIQAVEERLDERP